MLEVRVSIRG